MAALLSPNAKQQFFDNAGNPAAGYKLYTYAANTTNPQATYTNRAGSVPNTNPIILDARGEAIVYLSPGVVYDYVLKTASDGPVWTREDVAAQAGDADAIYFTSSVAGAQQRLLSDRLDEWRSVKDFGAVGNGLVDDTAALQVAINSAVASGFSLLFPDGNYVVSGNLSVSAGQTAFLGALSTPGRVTITKTGTGDLFSGGAVIRGLNFVHQGSSGRILELIEDGSRAEDCSFVNAAANASDMIHATRSSHYFGRNYFTINNANSFAIHMERTAAGLTVNNAIDNHNEFAGVGKCVRLSSSVVGARPEGISIEGNLMMPTGQQHILVQAVLHLNITRNVIDQSSIYCIDLAPGSQNIESVSIHDNYLATAQAPTTGFAVETQNGSGTIFHLSVTDNLIENSGFGVVLRDKIADFVVTGNKFSNIAVTSLSYNGALKGVLGFNNFRGANTHMALIDGSTGQAISVVGNVFPTTGSVTYTPTDRARFEFRGNVGKRFDGWGTVQLVAPGGTGVPFTCPHGLAVTPDIRKIAGAAVMESGNYTNIGLRIDSVDATNITGAIHYTLAVSGNLRVNLYSSA